MRLCSIILLASNAVSVCIAGAPGVTDSSTKEADISSTVPFVGDDSNSAPANRRLRAHDAISGEERVPVPPSLISANSILKNSELAVRKLYDGTNKFKFSLRSRAWNSVMNADREVLKHVIALAEKQQHIEKKQVPKRNPNKEIAPVDLLDLAQANHLQEEIKKLAVMKWMADETSGQLVDVMRQHRVFGTFSYMRVQALKDVLAKFNEAYKTEIKLLDTLIGVYGGVGKLARLISAAKVSGLTGEMIKPLQVELAKSLRWENFDQLLDLLDLNLVRGSLTYETLDMVVVCVALRDSLSLDDALSVTFTRLRAKYNDGIVREAITRGKKNVESAKMHLVHRYEDYATVSKDEEANHFAELLESWLGPKPVDPSLTMDNRIRAAGTSLDEKSLELLLKPPGT